jgi:acetyl-CoA carboxylase carboxyl transferase subunit alpha
MTGEKMEHHHVMEFEKPLIELQKQIDGMKKLAAEKNMNISDEIRVLEEKADSMRNDIYKNLTTWQIVQIQRHPKRPRMLDLAGIMFSDFKEMHGDRSFGDDRALIGGMAKLDDITVMIIGLQKGKDTKENILRNFGMSQPEGYRKALRLMKFAEKFGLPVLTFIDTDGAFPGLEGEERGAAEAIARNLLEMARLRTPIIVNVIGMGGSGGALGVGVGDRVLMFKYATYSVINYEGAASILWKDATRASEAAKALKPTAKDLLELKVIDEIVEEPVEGAHTNYEFTAQKLKAAIIKNLDDLMKMPPEKLLEKRYKKFRDMGVFTRETETDKNNEQTGI